MMNRRRFLMIAAAFAAGPAHAGVRQWQGRAFGGEVSIRLSGPPEQTDSAIAAARSLIFQIEHLFNLHYARSDLARLNRQGRIKMPPRFAELVKQADRAFQLTEGLFDPTVQPLWKALAASGNIAQARAAIGWTRVNITAQHIILAPGQALTFNGIAQGFATDLVFQMLSRRGFSQKLVNIGEFRASGGPWRLGIEDPIHGFMTALTIKDGAVATSSPMATPVGRDGHIVHGVATPKWATVTVEAPTATLADALSTALVLADRQKAATIARRAGARRLVLVAQNGDLQTIAP